MASPFQRTTQSLSSDSSFKALLFWIGAGVFLAVWLTWFFGGRVTVFESSNRAHVEVMRLAAPVASTVAGKVLGSHMVLGEEVKAGDVLVRLDASQLELRLREEETRLRAFAPRTASLYKEINALELARSSDQQSAAAAGRAAQHRATEASVALDFGKDNERRIREISAQGGISQIDALRALSESQKLASTQGALSADVQRIDNEARTRGHQQQAQIENLRQTIVALEGERATVEATVTRLRNEVDRQQVLAPVSGKIGEIVPLTPGTYVAEGQKLATIVPSGELIIVADFPPAAAFGRIFPGQQARLRLDGFPWGQYGSVDAQVVRVASEIRDQMVRVEFSPVVNAGVSPIGPKLQHGLPGAIEVSLEKASPADLVLRATGQWLAGDRKTPQQTLAGGLR